MKKNDILLIIGILLLAGAVFMWSSFVKREEGGKAVVYVDGETAATYDLAVDGEFRIKTEYGENLLIIKDGKADMTEADCPDGLCVKQHDISKKGETIVCLPHRVVVEIEGGEASDLDAIAR